MEKDFDFNSIGKRMPYQVPDGFFDQLEKDVWKEIKEEPNQGKNKLCIRTHIVWGSIATLAAGIAFLLLLRPVWMPEPAYSFSTVEEAFSNLCLEDQDYLFETYQDDVFLDNVFLNE